MSTPLLKVEIGLKSGNVLKFRAEKFSITTLSGTINGYSYSGIEGGSLTLDINSIEYVRFPN